ncbi:hypothetical protein TgHK011_005906 [Trichoderma gracile]|nr:hypothetical protein TgHK011_005906 [Trichoderma gracile]
MIFAVAGPRHQNAARLRIARAAAEPPRGPQLKRRKLPRLPVQGMDGAQLVEAAASSASPRIDDISDSTPWGCGSVTTAVVLTGAGAGAGAGAVESRRLLLARHARGHGPSALLQSCCCCL